MMIILLKILSNVLGAIGIISLIRISKSRKLDYLRKMKGINTFFFGVILFNVIFYFYFFSQILLYNLVVVKSEYSEKIDGFVGGYCTPEDVATNYFGLSNFLTWSFFIVNIILFLSRFFLKTKPNVNSKNESSPKLIFTILLILSSIILCFISLIFTVFLDELWYINIC